MKKIVKTDQTKITGNYITHEDREVDGLKFRNVLRDGNFKYTIVEGGENEITKWKTRNKAVEITTTDVNDRGKDLTEIPRKCPECGQTYTPKWVNITL